MRVKVNLRPALAGWALAVVAVAAFVSSAGTAQAEPLGDGGKVRLLYNEAGTNSFIPFTIRKFGLDKKHGFELVPVPTTTTAAGITAMKAGAGDVHTYGWNDIARMNNSGIPVVGVAPFLRWGADFILVSKDSPIKTIGDLKGKKVGTSARTALNWVAMMALGDKKYQLTEKDMTIHEGAPPLLRALLEQGSLDATHMFNSVTPSMIVSGKSRVLAKVSDLVSGFGMPDTPFLLYAFDTKYVAAKPQNVKAFVAAYQDAGADPAQQRRGLDRARAAAPVPRRGQRHVPHRGAHRYLAQVRAGHPGQDQEGVRGLSAARRRGGARHRDPAGQFHDDGLPVTPQNLLHDWSP